MTVDWEMTVRSVFATAHMRLAQAGIEMSELDAGILLEHVTGHGALTRLTRPETVVTARQVTILSGLIDRRLAGEPVHRIIGWREFYGLPLQVREETLVPRPDTETLVDLALPFVRETARVTGQCRILDLGTGTGAIALALLSEVEDATAIATDISLQALDVAESNARTHDLAGRFKTVHSDWFASVTGLFDLIISNPPYIASADIDELMPEVRDHDPLAALDGGLDGLDAYSVIATRAPAFLKKNGLLAVEIGHTQADDVTTCFEAAGWVASASARDLGGHVRALTFRFG